MGQRNYVNGFDVAVHESALELPLKWKKPHIVFVNSMSDLFHEQVPTDFVLRVFDVMTRAHWHSFQILTKRSEKMAQLNPQLPWASNIWIGVSVETAGFAERIDHLRQTTGALKFLSFEPLLGPLPNLDLSGIDWVIVGGESGPRARAMDQDWVIDIREQCTKAGVPFFFKQWGGTNKKKTGRVLEGRTWDEMPLTRPARSEKHGETSWKKPKWS